MLQLSDVQNKCEPSSEPLLQSFFASVLLPLKPCPCLCAVSCLCSRLNHPVTHLHWFQWHHHAHFQSCTWNTHHGKLIKASAHGFSGFEFVLFSVALCQDGFCSFMMCNHCHQGIITQWWNTLILPFYWKEYYFCFTLLWVLEVALPCQEGSVWFYQPTNLIISFWPPKVLWGFVVDIVGFFLGFFCHYITLQSTKATQIGVGLPSTSQLSPLCHLYGEKAFWREESVLFLFHTCVIDWKCN